MKKRPKLTKRARELSKKTVREEIQTRQYPKKQAVAIGLSRAREQAQLEHSLATARKYL